MNNEIHHFSVEEANAALELIQPLVVEIMQIRQEILDHQPEVWPVFEKVAGNGGNKVASQMELEFERLDALVHRIQATGAIMKDLNSGLIDFPSLRDEQEIYLCWQFGEPHVMYWHDREGGFAGRKLI